MFGEIASIEVDIDYPSKHDDKMMPILDMKMAINDQEEEVK